MNSTQLLLAAAAVVQSGLSLVALAVDTPNENPKLSYPYPKQDYNFQDHRSIYDILAGRVAPEHANAGDPEDIGPPPALCYDPASPPSAEIMALIERNMRGGGYGSRYNIGGRWNRGSGGDPIALSWSFVPDGTIWGEAGQPGGAAASNLFSNLDARFGGIANRQTWITQFQRCFDRWHALSGVTYTRIRNATAEWDDGAAWGNTGGSTRGDCRIGMHNIDGPGGILAYNYFPDVGDMMLDSSDNYAAGAPSYLTLRNVVMHEHGHGLGFNHVCPQGSPISGGAKLMAPFIDTSFDGPQQDEIRAVQDNYGDPYEPNNSSAAASVIATLTPGVANTIGNVPSPTPAGSALLSIDNLGEQDWYRYTVDIPRLINVTVTPFGTTYFSSSQDGNCTGTGATTNALAAADLLFDVRVSSGTQSWRIVNNTAAGALESLTNLLVSPAGNFFVKVYATGSMSESQLYKLTVTAQNVSLAPTATDGTFGDKVRITWPSNISDATGYQITRNTTNTSTGSTQVGQVAGNVFLFDDVTAVPSTTYFYFVRVNQPGNVGFRYMTASGDSGFRTGINLPPVANAGPDQTVVAADNISSSVTLNGSLSNDPDGSITNYNWVDGPTTLANGPSASSNVNLAVGVHTITLTVTDNVGTMGTDTVVITVNTSNQPPVANAGPDQNLVDSDRSGSETVALNGGLSSDPNGPISNYLWQEGAATLANGPSPAANVALPVGPHTITLTVTDPGSLTAVDTVSINIGPGCAADYNNDGGIDGNDIEAFFIDWSAGIDLADVNSDGGVNGGDVEAFFFVWGNGSC